MNETKLLSEQLLEISCLTTLCWAKSAALREQVVKAANSKLYLLTGESIEEMLAAVEADYRQVLGLMEATEAIELFKKANTIFRSASKVFCLHEHALELVQRFIACFYTCPEVDEGWPSEARVRHRKTKAKVVDEVVGRIRDFDHFDQVSPEDLERELYAAVCLVEHSQNGEASCGFRTDQSGTDQRSGNRCTKAIADHGTSIGRSFSRIPEKAHQFNIAKGTTWKDVRMRFLDGETLTVEIKGKKYRLNFAEMGMADGRNKRPTMQWRTLYAFAEARNRTLYKSEYSLKDIVAVKKRVEKLSADLTRFFGIRERPIQLLEGQSGWQVVFRLEPESRM